MVVITHFNHVIFSWGFNCIWSEFINISIYLCFILKLIITVKTGCDSSEIVESDNILVKLKSRPVDGKANLELVKLLSKHFKKKVKIVSGFSSKKKVIEIED